MKYRSKIYYTETTAIFRAGTVISIGEIKIYDRLLLNRQTGHRTSLLTQPRPVAAARLHLVWAAISQYLTPLNQELGSLQIMLPSRAQSH
jgi:hypothetical protein